MTGGTAADASETPNNARNIVFTDSSPMEEGSVEVKGLNWDNGVPDLLTFTESLSRSGFQGTQIGRAVVEIRRMLGWRPSEEALRDDCQASTRCTIWLSFTSNMISSGRRRFCQKCMYSMGLNILHGLKYTAVCLREVFVYLAKHKMVDVFVTSAGGVEEDFIKCLHPTYLGDFNLEGKALREKGWNRIGNLLVPNKNYCAFEDWVQPLLDECLFRQQNEGVTWTPSRLIDFLGSKIHDESSLYFWCHKNGIPVFCPGITDGSLGDNIYFHSYRNPGLVIDVAGDIRRINDIALNARKSGIVILGGGIAKHHTCNANLMRNGADFAVYINTAQEFDGCDSGARPDEAVSWGKIRADAKPVKPTLLQQSNSQQGLLRMCFNAAFVSLLFYVPGHHRSLNCSFHMIGEVIILPNKKVEFLKRKRLTGKQSK